MAPALTTLTLWNCNALEILPDLTPIPGLQVDGVPEQLADWEAEQKRKRQQDAAAGRLNTTQSKAPQGPGWKEAAGAFMGGDKKRPSVAGAALANGDGSGGT